MKPNYKRFMKTTFFMLAMTLVSMSAKAQSFKGDYGFFDHVGAGISFGTDGIGIDVASPVTDWASVRAGISFMPAITYKKTINLKDEDPAVNDEANVEAKLNVFDFKFLADFYPFKASSFHITAGFFAGSSKFVTATSDDIIRNPSDYGKVGVKLGQYRISSDENGHVEADVKVNGFKPYIGIGFGRAVPKKSRVSVSCDFGVKFWGHPKLGVNNARWYDPSKDFGDTFPVDISYSDLDAEDNKDLRDAMEIADKITVYPVLNIRICGRIF